MEFNDIVMSWHSVKEFINPTIQKYFLKSDSEEVNLEKYRPAEADVTAALQTYIPCFNSNSKGLTHIWAAIFNFTFIGHANEKLDNGFSQITVNYNKAIEWLQSDEAQNYCKQKSNENKNIYAKDIMKFGHINTIKF